MKSLQLILEYLKSEFKLARELYFYYVYKDEFKNESSSFDSDRLEPYQASIDTLKIIYKIYFGILDDIISLSEDEFVKQLELLLQLTKSTIFSFIFAMRYKLINYIVEPQSY